MHVSTTIRTATVGLAVAAIAACSDTPSAPQQAQRQLAPAVGFFADKGGTANSASGDAHNYGDPNAPLDSATFTFNAADGKLLTFGQSFIYIPGNAICDPSSGYGAGTWNTPCAPYTGTVTIQVVWSTRNGHTYAEFEPAMRFDPNQNVYLVLFDRTVRNNKNLGLLWRDVTGGWVNEALGDPSLGAVSINGSLVGRRIKHFSGYNVSAGGCDPTVDASCGSGGF